MADETRRTTRFAIGCLYTVQGSTLGGKVISRQLDALLHGEDGRRFFRGFPQDGANWQALCAGLEGCEPISRGWKRAPPRLCALRGHAGARLEAIADAVNTVALVSERLMGLRLALLSSCTTPPLAATNQ